MFVFLSEKACLKVSFPCDRIFNFHTISTKAHLLITSIHSTCDMEALNVRRSRLSYSKIPDRKQQSRIGERMGSFNPNSNTYSKQLGHDWGRACVQPSPARQLPRISAGILIRASIKRRNRMGRQRGNVILKERWQREQPREHIDYRKRKVNTGKWRDLIWKQISAAREEELPGKRNKLNKWRLWSRIHRRRYERDTWVELRKGR